MPKPYAQDLRDRVIFARDRGMRTKVVAETFKVSPAWVRRILQARREEGRTTPLAMGGARVTKIDMQRLRELVDEQPDATIAELHQRLGADCSESAVAMALDRLELTFKKRRCMRPSRGVRMSLKNEQRGVSSSRNDLRQA